MRLWPIVVPAMTLMAACHRAEVDDAPSKQAIAATRGGGFKGEIFGRVHRPLSGGASLHWDAFDLLSIILRDTLVKPDIFAISFRRAGIEHMQVGSYVVLSARDAGWPNALPGTMELDLQTPDLKNFPVDEHRISGTLVIERADTFAVEGHVNVLIVRNGASPRILELPDSLRDTVRISGRFRAAFDPYEEPYLRRMGAEVFPHPLPTGPALDAQQTLRGLSFDERVPCERVPGLLSTSVFPSIPPSWQTGGHYPPGTMVVAFRTDSAGAVELGSITVLKTTNRELDVFAARLERLRFQPVRVRGLPAGRSVRCTLTVRTGAEPPG